ncbi:unnamed protein product, partial [Pylaiella littoralis]
PTSDLPAVRATISTSETLCQGRVLFFHGRGEESEEDNYCMSMQDSDDEEETDEAA